MNMLGNHNTNKQKKVNMSIIFLINKNLFSHQRNESILNQRY